MTEVLTHLTWDHEADVDLEIWSLFEQLVGFIQCLYAYSYLQTATLSKPPQNNFQLYT